MPNRPQDKPTHPPLQTPAPIPAHPAPEDPLPHSSDPIVLKHEVSHQGWEEPTTVQSPTWDDEPQVKPSVPPAEVWPEAHKREDQEELPKIPQPEAEDAEGVTLVSPVLEPALEPQQSLPPVQSQEPRTEESAAPPTPKHTRPLATSHRNSARYNPRTIDQPVVLPSSIGSGIEKFGMQFGSLSLGGESLFDSSPCVD
jgi:hypothetical protein